MLNEDMSADEMLIAEDLLSLWARDPAYTLYCGPGTEGVAEVIAQLYPNHAGGIELGIYMQPGTMAVSRELQPMPVTGTLPPHILRN